MRISVPTTMGFGTAPLGNMYRNIPTQEALATVEAAWQQGIRYFDAAPMYGAGLAELRLGEALQHHRREDYVLSTKVGRLILDEVEDTTRRWRRSSPVPASPAASPRILHWPQR